MLHTDSPLDKRQRKPFKFTNPYKPLRQWRWTMVPQTPLTPLNAFDSAFICGDEKITLPFWRNEELELDDWQGSAIDWD